MFLFGVFKIEVEMRCFDISLSLYFSSQCSLSILFPIYLIWEHKYGDILGFLEVFLVI